MEKHLAGTFQPENKHDLLCRLHHLRPLLQAAQREPTAYDEEGQNSDLQKQQSPSGQEQE